MPVLPGHRQRRGEDAAGRGAGDEIEELGDRNRALAVKTAAEATVAEAKNGAPQEKSKRPQVPTNCTINVLLLPAHDEADEIVGLMLAQDLSQNSAIVGGLVVTAAACATTLVLIFSPRAASLVSFLPGRKVVDSIRKYAAHSPQLLAVLVCSVAVQALRVFQAFFLGRSLGIDAPLAAYFAFIPLILLIMLLPITVNGLGTSQAAFVWFFARAGVASATAFALSVLFVALGIVGNLPGALLYAAGSGEPDARATTP